ncbi:hypothetical protein KQX54_021002 [Cotesia glomerata]|uniref:Uncharacterized protein n=1 Tax=Cotesia glomerata TaxID=32391 RepID=A0AAV7IGE0_COTGL|nr:hypothetical protein KQX54_021002 [Cotesia glomerata]
MKDPNYTYYTESRRKTKDQRVSGTRSMAATYQVQGKRTGLIRHQANRGRLSAKTQRPFIKTIRITAQEKGIFKKEKESTDSFKKMVKKVKKKKNKDSGIRKSDYSPLYCALLCDANQMA